MKTCNICHEKPAVSREGWCLKCLRARLNERFGYIDHSHVGAGRTAEQKQAREGDPSPWQENAVRAMEGG